MILAISAFAASVATAEWDGSPNVPRHFLRPDQQYTISVEENFNSLDNWDKQLGEWVGTVPGAFNDANSEIVDHPSFNQQCLQLTAKDQSGFFPPGVDATCDCGFKEISTGIVVSKQMYKYGFFEIEASMPDASLLSSIWLQGMNGEINIADVSNTASAGKVVSHNYHCFDSTDSSSTTTGDVFNFMTNEPVRTPNAAPVELSGSNDGGATNLAACTGECDNDGQCAAGLTCFQRQQGEAIPGCTGDGGGRDWDYCYDDRADVDDDKNMIDEDGKNGFTDFDVTEFHTYGIHWNETGVTYFIDGEKVGTSLSAGCLDEEMNVVLSMETIATDVPDNFGSHAMKVNFFRHYTVDEITTTPRTTTPRTTTTITTITTTPEPVVETVCDGDNFMVEKKFKAQNVCASAKPQGKCYKKAKLADAEEECAAVGARMCTVEEIKGSVARTLAKSQCKVHGKPVWTSTECTTADGEQGVFVTRGDGKNAKKDDCIPAKKARRTKRSLMCCADVGATNAPDVGMKSNGGESGTFSFATTWEGDDSDGEGAGGSAAAAAIAGLICVVAIIGVAVRRRRQAGADDADAGADRRASVVSVETEGRRYSAVPELADALPSSSMMEPMAVGGGDNAFVLADGGLDARASQRINVEAKKMTAASLMSMGGGAPLENDNGFVLDADGSLRVASVKRGNPMYRNSVYLGAEDEIGEAAMEEASEM